MCVIIFLRPNQTIPRDYIERAVENNPDGYGYMTVNTKTKETSYGKGYSRDFTDVARYLYEVRQENIKLPFAMHLRFATHGKICEEQSHPFELGQKILLMHNGVIHNEQYVDATKSDTCILASQLSTALQNSTENDCLSQIVQELQPFSFGNKFLFALPDKGMFYFPKNNWEQLKVGDDSVLVSNTYSFARRLYSNFNKKSKKALKSFPRWNDDVYSDSYYSPIKLPYKTNGSVYTMSDYKESKPQTNTISPLLYPDEYDKNNYTFGNDVEYDIETAEIVLEDLCTQYDEKELTIQLNRRPKYFAKLLKTLYDQGY